MTGARVAFEVLATGPSLLVQDLGRPGFAHLAVPPSGALDPAALALANRLVGNRAGAAGIEFLLGGVHLRALASVRIAVTGAVMDLKVGGRLRPWGEAVSVRAGDEVRLGPPARGLRGWLAVAGGVISATALGSASTDTLTGLGPAPLEVGDLLRVGAERGRVSAAAAVPAVNDSALTRLRIRLGPRDDWFTSAALGRLVTETYAVSADSNRVAIRLASESGLMLSRRVTDELPSEGLVTGAVQVPASGEPLVFLADHPVTGGYPVVAVVDPQDLARCAQLRPGDRVCFSVSG